MGGTAEAIAEMQSTATKIDGKLLELQAGVNNGLRYVPGFLEGPIHDKWNEFCKVMKEAWDYYRHILENLGDPDTLRATADAWSKQISAKVSEKQQVADAGTLWVDTNWDGSAADNYRGGLPKQKTALEKIRTSMAEPAVANLNELASAITWFIWELVAALGVLLVGIITAIALVETIIGAIIAGIAAGVAFCSAVIAAMIKMKSDASTIKGKLRTAIDDNSGTENGHWPILVDTTGRAMQPGG